MAVGEVFVDGGDVVIAHELAVLVVVAGREGENLVCKGHQHLGLRGEHNVAALGVRVKEGAYAYGVARGDKLLALSVVNYYGKLGVEHFEHFNAVLLVQGEEHFAVGIGAEFVALLN